MNIERVINMILRRLVGRAVNAGVNAGIKAVSKRGKGQAAGKGADKDTRPLPQDEATAQKARLMRRNTRPPRFKRPSLWRRDQTVLKCFDSFSP
ncbi:hypothetical protein [Phaeobacter gallaeciensis]|uniref:hypothetical protein n=1 Tax=Phaeobacter gallaeciensis TaxID=60890 RepID=UPI000BBF4231|nr:hypothetical protein [Phaeobacter gallaeciensis]ATF18838.1 hypothetical protein PhaeoP129_02216 [Phaeobacter gallaeciensis]ATF22947.1 hypothetical protein PhaeoP128_02216 [Phaeobacter gallaeciensis]